MPKWSSLCYGRTSANQFLLQNWFTPRFKVRLHDCWKIIVHQNFKVTMVPFYAKHAMTSCKQLCNVGFLQCLHSQVEVYFGHWPKKPRACSKSFEKSSFFRKAASYCQIFERVIEGINIRAWLETNQCDRSLSTSPQASQKVRNSMKFLEKLIILQILLDAQGRSHLNRTPATSRIHHWSLVVWVENCLHSDTTWKNTSEEGTPEVPHIPRSYHAGLSDPHDCTLRWASSIPRDRGVKPTCRILASTERPIKVEKYLSTITEIADFKTAYPISWASFRIEWLEK